MYSGAKYDFHYCMYAVFLAGKIGGKLYFEKRRGPFLESPGNFSGPKSNIQIEM